MPVTVYLERNAKLYPNEIALVELNPEEEDTRRITWKEYDLIQPGRFEPYRRSHGACSTRRRIDSQTCS